MYTDLDKVVAFLRKKCGIWRPLSAALKVPRETLEDIAGHCKNDFDSLVEVCDAWLVRLREKENAPSWQELLSALEEIDAQELATELNEMLETGTTIMMMNAGMTNLLMSIHSPVQHSGNN